MILLAVIIMLNRQKKIHKLEKENAKLIVRQVVEEKENISKKLITASSELKRKDQLLEKTKSMDKNQLHKAIRFEQKKNKLIANYTELFQQIRPEFYERLQQSAAPNKLSNSDLKYCAYISLRTDNKELANIMDVNYSTVLTKKYRLKKKLHLSVQDNLEEFIVKFTPLR